MANILTYAQIGIAIAIIIAIMFQQRGTGLSSTFGGGSMEYSTKRGLEKGLFYTTIVLAVIWIIVSVVRLIL